MYQNAPRIHYKVAQHIHNGNGKYQLQSAHFLKLMLVLSMKIMPRYKMLAPATATNSISWPHFLLQNHRKRPVCAKHSITHFVVEIGTGMQTGVLLEFR